MNRRHVTFDCEGSTLVGSLDDADGSAGLLIVTGGNEVRSGAWNGQARFAARIAEAGFPVFRFDRRGVGDSEGPNLGFRESALDIAAALAAFHEARPGLSRVVGFGNCDGASALMLAGGAGFDGLVLSNPWTFEDAGEDEAALVPAAVVRDHYRRRLTDPAAIKRLLTGKVSIGRLFASLRQAASPSAPEPTGLAAELAAGITGFAGQVVFPLAGRDRTAQAFMAQWRKDDPRLRVCADATHSYVEPAAQDWLIEQVLEMLRAI
jgi:exosortase A-associated hydrolase 1